MSETFLTAGELVALTGFKARHCQVRWLEGNRWRFALTRNGEPRVAREHFNERMGCGQRPLRHAELANLAAAAALPDFSALDRR